MKKIVFIFLSLSAMFLTGCEKIGVGKEVDWAPVCLYLKVTDEQGADLLDPENPNNMIDGTTITYKGETYESSRIWYETGRPYEEPATRAILARLYGLYLINSEMLSNNPGNGFSLMFGEIDGAADMDEDLVVTLPNGTLGTIHYHCSDHNEWKISCKRKWKFNGSEHDGNVFTFVVSD